jgi:hypothetical protein
MTPNGKLLLKRVFLQKNENKMFLTVFFPEYFKINCDKQLKRENSIDERV